MGELAENFPPSVLDHILPFKGRKCDIRLPVTIYRNLNDRKGDRMFSVKQGNLVVGHTRHLVLHNVSFRVSKAGQERVRRTKQRNVHAFMIGTIEQSVKLQSPAVCHKISYNPFKGDKFTTERGSQVDWTGKVAIRSDGVYTCY